MNKAKKDVMMYLSLGFSIFFVLASIYPIVISWPRFTMLLTFPLYFLGASICLIILLIKYRNGDKNGVDRDGALAMSTAIFILAMISVLDFGLLFMMIMPQKAETDLISLVLFIVPAVYFLFATIWRFSKKNFDLRGKTLGLLDLTAAIYAVYGVLIVIVDSFRLMNVVWFIILFFLNAVLTIATVVFPISLAVQGKENNIELSSKTKARKFFGFLKGSHILFFITLSFSFVLASIMLLASIAYKENDYLIIALVYYGLFALRLVNFIWGMNIQKKNQDDEGKISHLKNHCLLFSSLYIVGLYSLYSLSSVAMMTLTKKQADSTTWMVYVQLAFIIFPTISGILDFVKAKRSSDAIDLANAGVNLLFIALTATQISARITLYITDNEILISLVGLSLYFLNIGVAIFLIIYFFIRSIRMMFRYRRALRKAKLEASKKE